MRSDITGVILAGGKSQRFGSDKALAPVGENIVMIQKIVQVMKDVFEETLILAKDKNKFSFLEAPWAQVLNDLSPEVHPLHGLTSALAYARTDKIFISACDMPFLHADLIQRICDKSFETEATVMMWQGRLQPFLGVYSKACLPHIEHCLKDSQQGIQSLLSKVRTRILQENEFLGNRNEVPFFDVDTPEEYEQALKILKGPAYAG